MNKDNKMLYLFVNPIITWHGAKTLLSPSHVWKPQCQTTDTVELFIYLFIIPPLIPAFGFRDLAGKMCVWGSE